MKVLHVIPWVSPKRGGPALAVRRMATGLTRLGQTVHIATTNDDDEGLLDVPLGVPVQEQGYIVWYFRRQTNFYTFSLPLTLWLLRHIRDYDLVHIHGLFSWPVMMTAAVAYLTKTPYIIRTIGTLNRWGRANRRPRLKRLSLRFIEKPLLARAARINYTSPQEQAEAQEAGVQQSAFVLPLGIDIEPLAHLPPPETFFAQHPHLAQRPIVLYLSRLHPIKRLDLLLDAFALVVQAEPTAALVIAGDGDPTLAAQLKAQVATLGIGADVTWTGFVDGESKFATLAAATLFVLPSESENFGLAAVEALAAGLPTILTTGVPLHTAVQAAGAGLSVGYTPDELAQAILTILRDSALQQKMGTAARALAASQYSDRVMCTELLTHYRAITTKASVATDKAIASLPLPVAAVILTQNEAWNLPDCLASLQGWVSELYVVDSGSTDATREIAARFGATVVEHPFEDYAQQRNWAQANLPIRAEWVLHLDADERVTPALKKSIVQLFQSGQAAQLNGALCTRRTIFMGRWIRWGGHYPVYHARLFRRSQGYCENLPYDQHFKVATPITHLRGDLLNVLTADLDTWSRSHLRWAGKEARSAYRTQLTAADQVSPRLLGSAIEQRRWFKKNIFIRVPLFWRAFAYFLWRYFILLGFLDGKEGLIFHFLQGCWFQFYVDAKLYEQEHAPRSSTMR